MGKDLNDYTKEELIDLVGQLKKRKKFGLVWEDKPEKVVEECQEKLPVLEEVESKAIEKTSDKPTNLIIEGDNYHALSVLNYTHAGKIDVIYIDPPYNTGNKDFIYNDSFVDSEDPFRHSKWLSFMEKRLELAKNLLSDDGVIFISIDDNEQANLKGVCDKIFNEKNFVANIIWQNKYTVSNDKKNGMTIQTEYIVVYTRNNSKLAFTPDELDEDYIAKSYKNPDNDPNGPYMTVQLYKKKNPKVYEVISPTGKKWEKPWNYTPENFAQLKQEGRVFWGKDGNACPRKKVYLAENNGKSHRNLWLGEEVGYQQDGGDEVEDIFGDRNTFTYPKPSSLIRKIIGMSHNNAIVLDFFAGSGTTGQAVLELNKYDNGNRHFILVTSNEANGDNDAGEDGIARKVTYPRIKTVITGVRPDGSKYSDGIPANVRYFKTDFVEKGDTTDDTREALIEKATDMIRIREDAFDLVKHHIDYKLYKNDQYYVVIIFNQFEVESIWREIEKLDQEKLPVHVYMFSYTRHANEEEIPEDTDLEWEAKSIPEGILRVYERIFNKGGKKNAA